MLTTWATLHFTEQWGNVLADRTLRTLEINITANEIHIDTLYSLRQTAKTRVNEKGHGSLEIDCAARVEIVREFHSYSVYLTSVSVSNNILHEKE
jgi:hypothetical protein